MMNKPSRPAILPPTGPAYHLKIGEYRSNRTAAHAVAPSTIARNHQTVVLVARLEEHRIASSRTISSLNALSLVSLSISSASGAFPGA
jgi:hypothetical protein